MTFTDEFLRWLYAVPLFPSWFGSDERDRLDEECRRLWVEQQKALYAIALAEAQTPVTLAYAEGEWHALAGPHSVCSECGLDGHHEIWCEHWRRYEADEP